ncbi:MAG: amidohydrolase [Acidimicrobiia bacterium]|nr:amidohydrolase [Acidimicrobiia bacterium]
MKTRFTDVTLDVDYPIVDADAHVNEPPDLWRSRVPARWRDRAPRVERTERGDVWVFDDGKRTRDVGLTATAGLSYNQFAPSGGRYDTMRPGSFDAKARLADMDIDGIHTAVIYPSVTLSGAGVYADERELQLACVHAYHDWLAEFCEGADGRLVGLTVVPTTGVDDAVAAMERGMELGFRGAVISCFPNGTLDPTPEDDRFWGAAQEAEHPVHIHIGSFTPGATGRTWPRTDDLSFLGRTGSTKAGAQAMPVASKLVFSEVLEKFPRIRVVLVESNIGWIPTFNEQVDDMFLRYRFFTGGAERMPRLPSELFHRNVWATFVVDTVGLELRHRLNLRHLMWSTDYPHTSCDWPNSRVVIERQMRGLPLDEVKLLLHTNAKELYRLDGLPDRV